MSTRPPCNTFRIRTYSLWVTVRQRPTLKRWQPSVKFNFALFHYSGNSAFTFKLNIYWYSSTASQAGVLHQNIKLFLEGKPLTAAYDGYASCPLVTGYDSCIMAEFDYAMQPKETFPFRQDCERFSMFFLKNYTLPHIYWQLMLNGDWNGPEPFRKFFAMFKRNRPSNA